MPSHCNVVKSLLCLLDDLPVGTVPFLVRHPKSWPFSKLSKPNLHPTSLLKGKSFSSPSWWPLSELFPICQCLSCAGVPKVYVMSRCGVATTSCRGIIPSLDLLDLLLVLKASIMVLSFADRAYCWIILQDFSAEPLHSQSQTNSIWEWGVLNSPTRRTLHLSRQTDKPVGVIKVLLYIVKLFCY